MTDEQIKALRKASEILCGNAYHDEAAIINALLADSGKGEAVAWTKVEALEAMTENEGSWIWKYDPLRPVESDDVLLYLAAPQASEAVIADIVHMARQQWQGQWTYTAEQIASRFADPQASEALSAEQERAMFEVWARDECMDVARGIIGAGAYNDRQTQAAWNGFKARAALNAPANAENRGEQAECAPRTDVEKDAALTQCAECAKWKERYEHVRDMDYGDFGCLAWSELTTEQVDAHIDEEIAAKKEES